MHQEINKSGHQTGLCMRLSANWKHDALRMVFKQDSLKILQSIYFDYEVGMSAIIQIESTAERKSFAFHYFTAECK